MRNTLALGLVLLSIACVSCAGLRGRRPAHCLVSPVPQGELPDGLALRGPMRFSVGGRDVPLDVVVRNGADGLVIVAIAEYGVRAFALRQRGVRLEVEGAASASFEHLARWTADALHRSLWIRPPEDAGSGPMVTWERDGEEISESGPDGERRRKFERTGTDEPVIVVIRERVVDVDNPWCGYRAVHSLSPESVQGE